MELTHILKTTAEYVIGEPIGFDALEMKISRGEYHGMSAEVSVGNLEFYGSAFAIIESAYHTDIDTDWLYIVRDETGREIYSGMIDLSTCNFQSGEYLSVSCKVGEVGIKTTFNNRAETQVDLVNDEDVDGQYIQMPDWLTIGVPSKHLLYTNIVEQAAEKEFNINVARVGGNTTSILFEKAKVNEFGNVLQNSSVFTEGEGFDDEFGTNTKMRIVASMDATIKELQVGLLGGKMQELSVRLMSGSTMLSKAVFPAYTKGTHVHFECDITDVPTNAALRLEVYAESTADAAYWDCIVAFAKKSVIKMYMIDNLPQTETPVQMLPVHEALNTICRKIVDREFACKSDWLGRPDSDYHPTAEMGGGALKAITNGYKIRGVNPADIDGADEQPRNMAVSFKDMITSLNALDCIGWGFSQEADGLCIRVERWDWFYKSHLLASFTNIPDVTTQVATDSIITSLKIGYKKYYTSNEFNSIDSIHSERTFTSPIKAVKKEVTATCDWIADNYAIEETRRAATDVPDTEEFKYDENIFLFELMAVRAADGGSISYYIGNTATNISGINIPSELINAKVSPRHMAARWKDYLFRAFNSNGMRLTAGKVNYRASFSTIAERTIVNTRVQQSLRTMQDGGATAVQAEDDTILYNHAIMDAETIRFTAPVSLEQYKAIKANPYGLISVNGKQGWIKEFTYNFNDSTGNFTLISKHE